MSSDQIVRTVHLVGSIRLPNEPSDPLSAPPAPREVFQVLSAALPGRLRRLPDGETGERHYFVNWQSRVFLPSPWILGDWEQAARSITVPQNADRLDIKLGSPGYDEYAVSAFETFADLQQKGVIDPGVRFQVCIPTTIQAICIYIRPEYRARVEPMYEKLLIEAIENIQARIPPEKLAFQFDCAMEIAMLEAVSGPGGLLSPWFELSSQSLVDRILPLARMVHDDAELGFHLCYGDAKHRHFIEPKNTANIVNFANLIMAQVPRVVDFLHFPVPKERKDDEYFIPLNGLRLSSTEVNLGLVHAHDLEGTQKRIETAAKFLPQFGVSTECGWGRTPVSDIESILEILKRVSGPENGDS